MNIQRKVMQFRICDIPKHWGYVSQRGTAGDPEQKNCLNLNQEIWHKKPNLPMKMGKWVKSGYEMFKVNLLR